MAYDASSRGFKRGNFITDDELNEMTVGKAAKDGGVVADD
jgi:outer membrane protein assembly factor BamE (lipoprotein component of BamABCDE complex)